MKNEINEAHEAIESNSTSEASKRKVVVPGEVLAEGMGYLPSYGTYRQGENVLASKIGLVQISGRALKIVPLSGDYLPKRGDVVIGKVVDVMMSGWRIEFNCAYSAVLSMKEATSTPLSRSRSSRFKSLRLPLLFRYRTQSFRIPISAFFRDV